MAPSPQPGQRPINLTETADRCEQHLDHLRRHASDSKRKHNSAKKKELLEGVITRVTGNIQSLKSWIAAIAKGRQTADEEKKASINAIFNEIITRVEDAEKALDHKLELRMWTFRKSECAMLRAYLYKLKLTSSRVAEAQANLWKALDEIRDIIGYLHNQIKTVLRDTPDQRERQTIISQLGQKRPKSYHVFIKAIGQMSEAERRSTAFGTYRPLWESFPSRLNLKGNVGNADDPGDGKIYDQESIHQVKDTLKAFYDAWSEATIKANGANPMSPNTLRNVRKVPEMAKICLVLRGMKQERLLDYFCDYSKDDKSLPLKEETIRDIFAPDDADHAKTFSTEQYRAVCRTWNDGEHISIAEEEPLPLNFLKEYGKGSYGSVTEKKHVFTGAHYACKEQISGEARNHLLREIARLSKLGHRHIVQFVKSYQRGNSYGILLQPAATTDLKKLLDRYRRNGFDYDRDHGDRRRDRVVLKPILLTVFGCLSRGLAHIHGSNIRHKDIKPANILYEKAKESSQARLLWADFGLAHDFGNSDSSKTTSKSRHRYSPRYAAPEIMEEFEARKASGQIGHEDSGDDDDDDAPEQCSGAPGKTIGHGRSSDIYSFGIVFLETLSYLIAEGPEPSIPPDFERCMPFWKNIQDLQAWAKKHIQRLPPENPLVFLFKLASRMIAHNPGDRPVISQIVKELTAENRQYFCATCVRQPEEPPSQAVIAEEQMVEGLENAKFLSESRYHVSGQVDGSVHEIDEAPPLPTEEPREPVRPARRSVSGQEAPVKRSSIRSPSRRKDRPPSTLRFSEEVISIVDMDGPSKLMPSAPLVEP